MAQNAPKPPDANNARAKNFLVYGFLLSVLLHLALGPFVHKEQTQTEEAAPEKVTVARIPTPPPTPPPTPTPKPTPPPTPPPKDTPPPVKQTPAPQQPKIKINTTKTESKSNSGPTENANSHTTGVTTGIPQGQGTAAPSTATPATPAPATPPPTPKPTLAPSCAHPNVPPTTIRAAEPDMPQMAQSQGITGTVQVKVTLDAASHVTAATIYSTPSALLNSAAVTAAKQSQFQTEIVNCVPKAADYIFTVDFTSQ